MLPFDDTKDTHVIYRSIIMYWVMLTVPRAQVIELHSMPQWGIGEPPLDKELLDYNTACMESL